MSDAAQGGTPKRRRARYLALGALVPLGAAAAAARPLAFPPKPIAPRDLLALAAGAENTGGARYGQLASVRADTALYTGITDAPSPTRDSSAVKHPTVYVVIPVEDRWMVVRADPAVDCMDTARLAVADSAGGLPRQYSGRLDSLPPALARRLVAALNRRTPDLTDEGRDDDRWSRRQLLPVMLTSRGGVVHRARCAVRFRQHAHQDTAETDSTAEPRVVVTAPPPPGAGPGPEELLSVARERGGEVAAGWLDGVYAAMPDAPAVREAEVNAAGYALLRAGRESDALALFRWNADRHPRSANAHDSLAEAYEVAGELAEALEHSGEALALVDRDHSLSGDFREQVRRAATERLARLR